MTIEISSSLISGATDTPLDVRTRIATLNDMESVENPFLGMVVYCVGNGNHYKVTGLKEKLIGALTVPNAQIDTYELTGVGSWDDIEDKPDTFPPDDHTHAISEVTDLQDSLDDKADATHIADTDNPHGVTKTQVGLGNADNTADADKPVSTAQQAALDEKLSASILAPTTAVYIDGNRTDDYTEDGSIAYPYKTIAAATAAHQEAASYFIAKGTYAETAEVNLYADSVVYGAYSSISGEAINIGEGCYVHNLMFYNTVNVAVNGNSPMFHYCRFMGATLNLDGSTDFDGCYISSATTFNVTMAASYSLRAFNSSIHTVISGACCMYFNDCGFTVASEDYVITSTGGLLSMVACLVYNTSTGGGISCDNGANGTSTYNFLISVLTNKDIVCGTAVSIIGGDIQYSTLTGAAIVFPARIQAALADKADTSTLTAHTGDADNPHGVTKTQVGLGNADNTADADKPVSTAMQTALDEKLSASILAPTTAVYIDGNRTDEYTEDGSVVYPYKTIAAATAAHQEAASYFIAKGTYAETSEINLYADSVVYGAYSTISGSAINVGEGCYVHNLVFYNTVNVAVNSNTPMFHYCRFMEATMNLVGSTDFDGCYISSSTTFNATIAASGSLRAFNSSIHTVISGACCMYFNDCGFTVASEDYVITSTGGLLSMVACLVYNTSTGGGISCDNGADGSSTCNFLVAVLTNKDIACGTAVSIIGGDVQYSSLTGAAVVFPARIQAALAAKADADTVDTHIADTDNPHGVTKTQVGLGNVDNTADVDKPVSTAQQAALDDKADTSTVSAHTGDTDNPHGVTKTQVGLENADNTADADKPVSTAQQTALDGKQVKGAAYSLGTALTGAISVDISNGDAQYGTLSGDTTLAYGSISNLEEGQGFILQLDNAAGQTFSFTAQTTGSITILDSGNTGIYKIAFSMVDGKIYYDGKSEVYC